MRTQRLGSQRGESQGRGCGCFLLLVALAAAFRPEIEAECKKIAPDLHRLYETHVRPQFSGTSPAVAPTTGPSSSAAAPSGMRWQTPARHRSPPPGRHPPPHRPPL